MEKLIINSYEEFASHLGEQLGVSDWLEVTQDRINLFADATLDHQWRPKVNTKALLHTDILPFRFFLTCGNKL